MSGDDLRVSTDHLGDLAVRQSRVAEEARIATQAVEGSEVGVMSTHGTIASVTSSALDEVLAARRGAGAELASTSELLRRKLSQAAMRYDHADDEMASVLDAQMQTGQP